MKKRFLKSIVPVVAASLLMLTSCGVVSSDYIILTEENKDSVKYTTAKTWEYTEPQNVAWWKVLGRDVMPLVGYWGPWKEGILDGTYFPDLRTDEMYEKVAQTGCNLIAQNNDFYTLYPETVQQQLDLCQKYGLGYFVADNAPVELKHAGSPIRDASTIKMDQEAFTAHFAQYATHPAYAGWYCVDEPAPQIHGSIETVANYYYNALEALGVKDCPMWVNLFPMGYVSANYGYAAEQYYREMASAVGYLSYDQYPFQYDYEDDLTANGFYANLNLAYKVAKELGISFQAFVATGGNWYSSWDDHKSVRPATIEQTVWQVNTFVAYGAQGIQYFTLNVPHAYYSYISEFGIEEGNTGAFDPFGNKTKYFYAMQMANSQILACDHILMNATHHGIISKGEMMGGVNSSVIEPLIAEGKFRELTAVSDDATVMIGCFDYKGKTALYVVNGSYYDDTKVTLSFDDKYCYDVIQRGKQVSVVTKNLTLQLSAGEAVMVALR